MKWKENISFKSLNDVHLPKCFYIQEFAVHKLISLIFDNLNKWTCSELHKSRNDKTNNIEKRYAYAVCTNMKTFAIQYIIYWQRLRINYSQKRIHTGWTLLLKHEFSAFLVFCLCPLQYNGIPFFSPCAHKNTLTFFLPLLLSICSYSCCCRFLFPAFSFYLCFG